MISDKKLLELINKYCVGGISFAEVLLASGKTVKEFTRFLKDHNIELEINIRFLDKGRGLNEEELKMILEGIF